MQRRRTRPHMTPPRGYLLNKCDYDDVEVERAKSNERPNELRMIVNMSAGAIDR